MKKILRAILFAGLIAGLASGVGAINSTDTDGTEENPHLISDVNDLFDFADNVNNGESYEGQYVELAADIDLAGEVWIPIGYLSDDDGTLSDNENAFSGTFDGCGYTVSNMTYNSESEDLGSSGDVGFFGAVLGGTVRNLTLTAVSVESVKSDTGGIVGYLWDGIIENCYVAGVIQGGDDLGGICGDAEGESEIWYCVNEATVYGYDDGELDEVGGIVGNNDGLVAYCLNLGSIAGDANYTELDDEDDEIGGIVGDNRGTVRGCINKGTIWGTLNESFDSEEDEDDCDEIGGIVGYNEGPVEDCVNYGDVVGDTVDDDEVGGIIGYNSVSYTYDEDSDEDIVIPGDIKGCINYGNVSGADEVGGIVGDAEENSVIILCSNYGDVEGEYNVGGIVGNAGQGTKITDCGNYGNVTGTYNVGGIAGEIFGMVSGCYNTGDVTGEIYVGGIIGYVPYDYAEFESLNADENILAETENSEEDLIPKIDNCWNTGDVTGYDVVGGIAGYNNSGWIQNCFNAGAVTGEVDVGGIAGYNKAWILNCYNTGDVTGGDYIGGLAGYNSGAIFNCYSTGKVTGDSEVGGLCGDHDNYYGLPIANSYWKSFNGELEGEDDGDNNFFNSCCPIEELEGGIAELLALLNDFVDDAEEEAGLFHWTVDEDINNGYPIFGEPEHVHHDWDKAWKADEEGHWLACNGGICGGCADEECEETVGYGKHVYRNGVCICGAEQAVEEETDRKFELPVEVNLLPRMFALTVTSSDGGDADTEGNLVMAFGSTRTFRFQADEGYEIADVTVNGVSVGAVESYTLRGAHANTVIRAEFKAIG